MDNTYREPQEKATNSPREQRQKQTADRLGDGPFPKPFRLKNIRLALIIGALGFFLIFFADSFYRMVVPPLRALPLDGFFISLNQWATTTAVIGIVGAIWTLNPKRRSTIVVFLVALGISGGTNECIKQLTGRARPRFGVVQGEKQTRRIQKYLLKHPAARIRTTPGDQWLLASRERPFFESGFASFPSGHSNQAFVMAAYLCALYPPARVVWVSLAGGCALSRVALGYHYPDDTLVGSALGWIMAQMVFSWSWPIRLGRRLIPSRSSREENSSGPSMCD